MDVLAFVRVVFAIIYLYFIPGFAASWGLYPKRGDIGDIERFGLSLVLSVSLTTLSVIAANYAGVKITALNSFLMVFCVTVGFSLLAVVRGVSPYPVDKAD